MELIFRKWCFAKCPLSAFFNPDRTVRFRPDSRRKRNFQTCLNPPALSPGNRSYSLLVDALGLPANSSWARSEACRHWKTIPASFPKSSFSMVVSPFTEMLQITIIEHPLSGRQLGQVEIAAKIYLQ